MYIQCNECMWRGIEQSLVIKNEEEFCPDCKTKGHIMDIDFQKAWEILGDTSINEDEEIEIPYFHFPVGTQREEIWHDLEDRYDISIGSYLKNKDNEYTINEWIKAVQQAKKDLELTIPEMLKTDMYDWNKQVVKRAQEIIKNNK